MRYTLRGIRGLVLPFAVASLLTTANAKGPNPDRIVTIDHQCYVDYYVVNLRYDTNHQHSLRWGAEKGDNNNGDSFDIVFDKGDDTPCVDSPNGTTKVPSFYVVNGKDSAKCYPNPKNVDDSFGYSIYWHGDTDACLDPVVVVQDGNNSDLEALKKLVKTLGEREEKSSKKTKRPGPKK